MRSAPGMADGYGSTRWGVARACGASAMELDAEPNAIGFYERMGARRVGLTASRVVPDRRLARMSVPLDE